MEEYEKRGYLDHDFRLFHLTDPVPDDIGYHYHDFDKVLLFQSGDVDYIIEGRSYHLLPGDIVLVSHHALHKPVVRPGAPYERYILYLSPDCLASYKSESCDLGLCFCRAKKLRSDVLRFPALRMSSLFQSLSRLMQSCRAEDGEYAGEFYRRLLFLEFLVQLNRAAVSQKLEYIPAKVTASRKVGDTARPTGLAREKILDIMRCISEDPSADLTIDGLASRFYLSKYHMMRLFKEETGYTVSGYISEKRLLAARELLREGGSVTEVCYRCGFKNYAAFLRAYKKAFHETPRAAVHS